MWTWPYAAFYYPSVSEAQGRFLATRTNMPLILGRRTRHLGWTQWWPSKIPRQNSRWLRPFWLEVWTVFIVLGPLWWFKWQFQSLVLLQYLTVSVSLPMAYSLPILERLVLCQCYRDKSFPVGVHVFLQRRCFPPTISPRSESVRRETHQ